MESSKKLTEYEDFLTKQYEIYEKMATRGRGNEIKVGHLDPNGHFGSLLVAGRLESHTSDSIQEWQYRARKRAGELLSMTPESALHVTLSNSGPNKDGGFYPSFNPRDKFPFFSVVYSSAQDYFSSREGIVGTIFYLHPGRNLSSIIISDDSVIAAGCPNEGLVQEVNIINKLFSDHTPMKAPWGTHTTLGRFNCGKNLDGEELAAIEDLKIMSRQWDIPETQICTVDIALQHNMPKGRDGFEYRVDPLPGCRFYFDEHSGMWERI